MMEVMKDLFLDASCDPENATKLHRKATQRFTHCLPKFLQAPEIFLLG